MMIMININIFLKNQKNMESKFDMFSYLSSAASS